MKKTGYLLLVLILTISIMMPTLSYAVPEGSEGGQPGTSQEEGGQGGSEQGNTNQGNSGSSGGSDSSDGRDSSGGNSGGGSDSSDRDSERNGNDTEAENTKDVSDDQKANADQNKDFSSDEKEKKSKQGKSTISIIFTRDIHSHLDEVNSKGGMARMQSAIDDVKTDYPKSFLFDAGDFSMGTAFQTIFMNRAAELKMMGELEFDATTLGNHEFDYGTKGLAKMFKSAGGAKRMVTTTRREIDENGKMITETETSQFMPDVVCANIDWQDFLADKEEGKAAARLKQQMNRYGVQDYTIIEKNGIKIAVFGIMGEEAQFRIANSNIKWLDPIDRAQEIVGEIKRNNEADMIVCLSHGGADDEEDTPDEKLAKKVDGIDVLIAGHGKDSMEEPEKIGDTLIVSAGEYTENIGNLVLKKTKRGLEVKKYKLIKLNKKVSKDAGTQSIVEGYKQDVNSTYLNKYGFTYDESIAKSGFDFISYDKFESEKEDNGLGNIVADSYLYAAKKAGKKYEDATCSIVANANICETIDKGIVTTSEAFNVLPLGVGVDGTPGYPLISFYLTGKELKWATESNASVSSRLPGGTLQMSGIRYGYNNRRMYLNKSVDIMLENKEGSEKIDTGKLYRVVSDIRTYRILQNVETRTRGLLAVIAKDKDGKEIRDMDTCVVKRGKREIKEWYALVKYMKHFKGDKVPKRYKTGDGRKVDATSLAPWNLLKQPNNYGLMLLAMIMIPIVIIVGIILYIRKRRYQRRSYERSMFGKGKRRRSPFKSRRMGISRGKRNRF